MSSRELGPGHGQPHGFLDPRGVVADGLLEIDVDADLGQPPRQVGRVGIDDLAEQQLSPDGDDLGTHDGYGAVNVSSQT